MSGNAGPCALHPLPAPLSSLPQTQPGAAWPFSLYYSPHFPDRRSNTQSYLKLGLFEWGEIYIYIYIKYQWNFKCLTAAWCYKLLCQERAGVGEPKEQAGRREAARRSRQHPAASLRVCYRLIHVIQESGLCLWSAGTLLPLHLKRFDFDSAALLIGEWTSLFKSWDLVKSFVA